MIRLTEHRMQHNLALDAVFVLAVFGPDALRWPAKARWPIPLFSLSVARPHKVTYKSAFTASQ